MPVRVGRGANRENVDTDMESREELATATAHEQAVETELATATAHREELAHREEELAHREEELATATAHAATATAHAATATAHAATEALLDHHQEKLATQVGTENGADARVTSVMYDGEEVPEVQVSTSKHLFQNGVWGIVVGLLLALGLLVLFPNIRCCVCTWRTRST